MIVAGVLSAILQITLIAWPAERYYYNYLSRIGQGIWCGVFFVLTGGLGVSAAQKPSTCGIVTLMVFSIISACMAVPHMTIDGIGIGEHSWRSRGLGFAGVLMYSILFVLGLAGGIISIVLSSYTCRAVCCRRTRNVGSVIYNPAASGAATQTIQLGGANNMDLAKLIATQQQQASQQQQQQPPSYNAVAGGNMYDPPHSHQLDLERGGGGLASKEATNTDGGAGETESLTGGGTGGNYQRFYN